MKFLCLDVDGVLIPRNTLFLPSASQPCPFHALDARALQSIVRQHVPVLILSGGHSNFVRHHLQSLGVHAIRFSCYHKFSALTEELLAYPNLSLANVLYVGDGLNDLECLQQVGFSACPSDADPQVSAAVKFRSAFQGGHGAIADALNWAMNPPVEGHFD